ncbi:MAG TPA: MOSC N-terminal beta barrel domain-containing protein [Nitrospiraceae bacterium]|nr:MOSC N-terminal beta barrel domain-containing protein [Nitrospiraceae bacterium]
MSETMPVEMGAVISLWRYPVKSMIGEELQTAQVTDRGLIGDRAYALIDEADGKVATAKNPGNGLRSSLAAPLFWIHHITGRQCRRSASCSPMA